MHDLHAADKILQLALSAANDNKLLVIKKIVIELGMVIEHGQDIDPDNLAYNIRLLSKNTPARGAEVIIKKVDSNGWRLVEIEG
jgi:Zn finger protein HypA/HybF involved in hydrogenase expression